MKFLRKYAAEEETFFDHHHEPHTLPSSSRCSPLALHHIKQYVRGLPEEAEEYLFRLGDAVCLFVIGEAAAASAAVAR